MAELVKAADVETLPDRRFRRAKGKRFSAEEMRLCLRLLAEVKPDGTMHSNRAIARLIGCKPETVASIRRTYADSTDEARAILKASAGTAAKNWIVAQTVAAKDGNHTPAKEHLAAVGVITDKSHGGGGGGTTIVIGIGERAVGPDPWVNVKQVPSPDAPQE